MMLQLVCLFAAIQDPDSRPKELREMESLRQDVDLLRLLNELKLTKTQAEKLVAASEAAQKKVADTVKESAEALEAATAALKEQRDALLKGETIPDEKMQGFHESQRKIQEIQRSMEDAGRAAAATAKEILSAEQLEELTWSTRHDPASQVRRWCRQMLPRVRDVPEDAFIDHIGENVIEFVGRLPMIPEEDREPEADRIFKVFTEAREMSAEDFGKKQADLLKKIVSEGKIGEIAKKGPGRGPEMENPLGRWMMQPRLVKLLKERK